MNYSIITRQNIVRKSGQSLLSLLLLGILLLAPATSLAQDDGGSEIPVVTVSVTDDGIEAPAEWTAGYVNIVIENNRTEMNNADDFYSITLIRLNDGVSMADFEAAANNSENPLEAVLLATLYGGVSPGMGESESYITNLIAGEYVLAEPQGESTAFASFTVVDGEGGDMVAPEAGVNAVMFDFGFGVPAFIPSGPQIWHIQNIGAQWHEIAMYRAEDGMSVADVMEAMQASEEEPEQVYFGSPLGADVETWVTIDLEPGTYVVLCFLPDLAGDFSPHLNHGMIQVFVVQ